MFCRVNLEEKTDIMKYIYSISNDITINNLIEDLINRDGVTNFFYNDDDSYNFSLVNYKDEKLFIFFRSGMIFVSNNFDGIRQQVLYQNDSDGIYLSIKNISKIDSKDDSIDRKVFVEKQYDLDYNLVFESKSIETIYENKYGETDYNSDENSYSYMAKYFIDGQEIRVNSVSYDSNPMKNDIKYSIYKKGNKFFVNEDEFNSLVSSFNKSFQKINKL